MRKKSLMWRLRLASFALFGQAGIIASFAAASHAEPPPIKPLFEKAVLYVGDNPLKPALARAAPRPEQPEYSVGERRFVIKNDRIAEINPGDGKELWSIDSENGPQLRWLFVRENIAYIAGAAESVQRLDLQRKEWLKKLNPAKAKLGAKIRGVLVDDEGIVTLASSKRALGKDEGGGKMVDYTLAFYQSDREAPEWSKSVSFSATEEERDSRPLLWSATRPDAAASEIKLLSGFGNQILVCSDESQVIFCIERTSGRLEWQLPRIWEFERNFIGPSVWNHVLTRFGLDHDIEGIARGEFEFADKSLQQEEEKNARESLTEAGKQFGRKSEAAIIGGPIVVEPGDEDDEWADPRIFVAVSKAPNGIWSEYLGECVIYELNSGGRPIAMCKLPRLVIGHSFQTLADGIVWSTQRGGIARIAVTKSLFHFGPGTEDCICQVDWYREFRPATRRAWFTADPISSVAAFSRKRQFRTVSGGFVEKADEAVYRFPIAEIDLTTGSHRELVLAVPLERQLTPPQTTVRIKNVRFKGESRHASGPYLLAITVLDVDEDEQKLKITLGMEGAAMRLEFPVPAEVAK